MTSVNDSLWPVYWKNTEKLDFEVGMIYFDLYILSFVYLVHLCLMYTVLQTLMST